MTPTYKEQFDKITNAYFSDTLRPMDSCACFIGNMLNGNSSWSRARAFAKNKDKEHYDLTSGCLMFQSGISIKKTNAAIEYIAGYPYTIHEIIELEREFLTIWINGGETEESLFAAMDSTLDMLRQIHEAKGEIIESFEFKQRPAPCAGTI